MTTNDEFARNLSRSNDKTAETFSRVVAFQRSRRHEISQRGGQYMSVTSLTTKTEYPFRFHSFLSRTTVRITSTETIRRFDAVGASSKYTENVNLQRLDNWNRSRITTDRDRLESLDRKSTYVRCLLARFICVVNWRRFVDWWQLSRR